TNSVGVQSEGEAEGGCGGNSASPEPKRSPAALLVQSRVPQKSFLFLLEEKIWRAQNKKLRRKLFCGTASEASGGGAERQFRSKKFRAKFRISQKSLAIEAGISGCGNNPRVIIVPLSKGSSAKWQAVQGCVLQLSATAARNFLAEQSLRPMGSSHVERHGAGNLIGVTGGAPFLSTRAAKPAKRYDGKIFLPRKAEFPDPEGLAELSLMINPARRESV
ncbi:MAG: hypothetical protein CEN87_271, partial [Parcubacteria group bacterium Licking1014_1]